MSFAVSHFTYSPCFRHVNNSLLISDASFAADITFEISLGRFETINCLLRMKS